MKLSRHLTCYLLVASLWSTPAIGHAQTAFERPDETWLVADITVPTIVDTFALMEVNRWPQAARGIRLATLLWSHGLVLMSSSTPWMMSGALLKIS